MKLTVEDIGQIVVFIGKDAKDNIYTKEIGIIKLYDNASKIAWVVYNCAGKWKEYENYTAASTEYRDLRLTNQNIITIS